MKFSEIIDVNQWKNIQDIVSSIVGMPLKIIDKNGEIIVPPSNIPAVCNEAVGSSAAARKKCWQWYPQIADYLNKQDGKKYYEYVCPLGMVNFAMQLVLNNSEPAYLIFGPIVVEDSEEDTRLGERIQKNGIDEEKFFECFNQLPAVSSSMIHSTAEFSNTIISFMKTLSALGGKSQKHKIIFNKDQINFLLKSFLDLAMKLCAAERGSMMMFEKSTQELYIKDSKGLSEDVVNNTKLKPGEGLAGLSIQNKKGLFLNDQLSDREVRLRMHKPKIKSAFVIPIFHKDKILGVISVGTAKFPNRFSDKLMHLLNELVGMALEKVDLD